MSVSDDGTRLYMTEKGTGPGRVTILDVTQVQQRVTNPTVPIISRTTWPNVGTPQYAEPFTENGHPYLMEVDEYGSGSGVGAGRILDLADEAHPVVLSNMRLAVHQQQAQSDYSGDPGAGVQFQGYKGHYCTLPTRVDPTVVACSFIASGLRMFDITDPDSAAGDRVLQRQVLPDTNPEHQGAWAMAAPAFSPRANEIWYSDGNLGFYAVGLTAAAHRVEPGTEVPEVPVAGLLPLAALLVLAAAVAIRRHRAETRSGAGPLWAGAVVRDRISGRSPAGAGTAALGLSIVKPCFSIVSTKSMVAPAR